MKLYKGSSRLPVLLPVLGIVIIIAGFVFFSPNTLEAPAVPSETSEEEVSTATPTVGNKPPPVSPATPSVENPSIKATSVLNLEIGELSGNMILTTRKPFREEDGPLAPNNVVAEFSGSATVTGTYSYYFSEFDGDWVLSFRPSNDAQLPQVDERSSVFFFLNQKEAEELLKIRNAAPEKGTATIEVRNYTLTSYPSEVTDKTTISSVE